MNSMIVLATQWHVMGIIGWIVLGGIAGWLASIVMHTNAQMGLVKNIIVGIVGAAIGGIIMNLIGSHGATGFNLWTLLVAFIGACVLIGIINLLTKGHAR